MRLFEFAGNFLALSIFSFQLLMIMPPMNLIFVGASICLASASCKRPFQNPHWKASHWFVLTQLLFFPAAITVGVLYPNRGFNSTANGSLNILALTSHVLAAFWVYRMKGFRWFALSLVTLLEMILMAAFNVAGMSVNDAWL